MKIQSSNVLNLLKYSPALSSATLAHKAYKGAFRVIAENGKAKEISQKTRQGWRKVKQGSKCFRAVARKYSLASASTFSQLP